MSIIISVTSESTGLKYKANLTKVTCTCNDFKYRRSMFGIDNPERLCKHLEANKKRIKVKETKTPKRKYPRKQWQFLIAKIRDIIKVYHPTKYNLCGSWRRGAERVGDLDFIISLKKDEKYQEHVNHLFHTLQFYSTSVRWMGEQKAGYIFNKKFVVDIRVVPEESFATALLHATGSGAENMRLRGIAKRKGMKLNEYALIRILNKENDWYETLHTPTEESVYLALGEPYKQPKFR